MKRGYLYILITTLLFSSMEVALKLISGQFNPIQLNFSRFLVGGLVLIPFAVRELKKRGRKLDGKALGSFALLGLMGIDQVQFVYVRPGLMIRPAESSIPASRLRSSACCFPATPCS